MERDTHYFLVGLFVIVTAVAGFLFGGLFYEKPTLVATTYAIHFATPVEGLAAGGEVRYMGIKVGEVASVSLLPTAPVQVAVVVSLESTTPVDSATVAVLRQQGLTGVPFISLEQDRQRVAEPLAAVAGEAFPVIPTKPTEMGALMEKLPDLEQRLTTVLATVDKVLDEKNRQQFAELLQHLNAASAELPPLLHSLRQASDATPALFGNVGKTSQQLGVLAQQMGGAAHQMEKLAADIDRILVNNEPHINGVLAEGGDNLKAVLDESRKTAVSIRQLGDSLRQNPSQILYQPAPQGTVLPP